MEGQQSRRGPIGNRAPASRRTTPDWKSIFRQPTPKQGVGSNKQHSTSPSPAAALSSSAGGPPATPTSAAARAPAIFTSTPPPSSPLLFGTSITPPASPLLFGTPPPAAPTLPPATTPGSASASKVPQCPRPTVVVVLPHWMPPELKPGPPGPEPGATPPQLLQALEAARTAAADLFSSSSSSRGSSAARKLAGVTAPEPQACAQHAPLGPPSLKPAHHWAPAAAAAAARLRQPAFDEDCHSEDSTRAASVSRGQLQQWQGTAAAAAAAAGGRGSWPSVARGSSGGGGVESMATSVTTGRLPGNLLRQQQQQQQQQRQRGGARAASTADTTTTGGGSSSKAAQRLASCMEQLALLQQQANTLF